MPIRIPVLASLLLLAAVPGASADPLKILTGAGMSMPVRALAADYGSRTGAAVTVVSDTAGGVQKRMEAGEHFDLVIGTQAVLETLTRENLASPAHGDLARMVAGISARVGTAEPALTDAAAVKQVLTDARSIAYVDPAMGGITGVFFLQQADKLGIGDAVRAKAVLRPNGTGVADAVANGEAQYGVTLISEMLPNKGVTVWPLPAEIQMTTIYTGAVTTNAENQDDARDFLAELGGPRGAGLSRDAGLVPVGGGQ